jgi:hypothetical protein
MINQVSYDIETIDGLVHLTITPVNQPLPGGDFYATGVYKLTDGTVGMGSIVFDEDMNEWEYDSIGDLTYKEAAEIADFIKNYKDPEGADPTLLG